MAALPELDLASPLQFVINAAAGSSDAQAKHEVIDAALRTSGRRADLLFCSPAELSCTSPQAATKAIATRTAVVAVGGDGTLNTVAPAANAAGCAMGVVPKGTFNYNVFEGGRHLVKVLGAVWCLGRAIAAFNNQRWCLASSLGRSLARPSSVVVG